MTLWPLVIVALLGEAPAVELSTLKDEVVKGRLVEWTADAALIKTDEGDRQIAAEQWLDMRFADSKPATQADPVTVTLVDGTRLAARNYNVQGIEAEIEASWGSARLPLTSVLHVQLVPASEGQLASWSEALGKATREDLLVVVKKEGVLDRLSGVAGNVGEKIDFLFDGDSLAVKRDRVFGIVYRRKAPARRAGSLNFKLVTGESLQATAASVKDDKIVITLAAGPELTLPATQVLSVDLSGGKVQYLSQMTPRDIKHVPLFAASPSQVWYFAQDRIRDLGAPMSLGGKVYRRGLFLFPRTTVTYRIGGDFRRLRTTVGIDDIITADDAEADLEIRGDGKVLHRSTLKATDPPLPLDLDVAGVRDLEILVDFGPVPINIGDYVDLADAKVLK